MKASNLTSRGSNTRTSKGRRGSSSVPASSSPAFSAECSRPERRQDRSEGQRRSADRHPGLPHLQVLRGEPQRHELPRADVGNVFTSYKEGGPVPAEQTVIIATPPSTTRW